MDRIPKYRIPVRISLVQEESVLGIVFVRQEQRILDMLCEPNPFFPVNTKTGMFLINKQSVIKLEVLDANYIAAHQENFPENDDETHGFKSHEAIAKRRSQHLPI
ncbi:MAG TPA: hypothetical protein VMO81_04500 [Aestuariivirgaceae bacterium]|nr:hypothetical protein [Aestuariivirgaceae bacterium]